MKLIMPPADSNLHLIVIFNKPKFDQMQIEQGLWLHRNLVESFELRLDDLKINRDSLSGQFYNFSKFYGPTFVSARFGFEEAAISLRNPSSDELIKAIIEKLFEIFPDDSFQRVAVNTNSHFRTEGDLDSFLASLVPEIPNDFKEHLQGRGAYYTLAHPEKNLRTSITAAPSMVFEKSLFLSIDFEFTPCSFNLKDVSMEVEREYIFITKSLSLVPMMENSNNG